MHPSRSLDLRALAAIAGAAVLTACSAGPAPSGVIPAPSRSEPGTVAVPSSAASPEGASSDEPTPSVIIPDESTRPSGDPGSGAGGEPTPSAPVNPTARPLPPAPADCGTGQEGFEALPSQVPADLHFGGATIEFTTATVAMRDGSYTTGDAIPEGVGLTKNESAVVVDPGTHVILRASGMSLVDLQAGSVAWSSVTFGNDVGSSEDTPVPLAWAFRSGGTISVTAPTEPGDYMVSFAVHWFTHCLTGDGVAYGRIKVNG